MGEREIGIGLLGCGTVGTGVLEILGRNVEAVTGHTGVPIRVRKVLVRDKSKPRRVALNQDILTTSFQDILDDDSIQIVVEVMGGLEPAGEYILGAFRRGKHVVTANKELLAKRGPEIFESSRKHGVMLRFEGSVAGGIPIIKPLEECLAANRIQEVMGIINGTTNYILTKMTSEGRQFEDVLREAQEKGFAEANPSDDIEGRDAAYKLAILASIAFGTEVSPDKVYTEGITKITPLDIEYARELGFVIKLLAIGKEVDGAIEARVHPTFVPARHPLASVNDAFNAIFVRGNAVGDLMFYGRGAGDLPTGSAVVADIIDVANSILSGVPAGAIGPGFVTWNGGRKISDIDSVSTRYYIHLKVIDRPGVLASIARAFGDHEVSLESVIQKGRGQNPVGLVFVTHRVLERNVRAALRVIKDLPVVMDISNVIRVEGEA
ncbi:MAG TPA: homoserine dehydrogenase [Firmicutes bacterium]|nr:homoserine dehydrogenase [Bacillota bacterium]